MEHDYIKLEGHKVDLTALDTQLACAGQQFNFIDIMSHLSGADQLLLIKNLVKENHKEEQTKNWMHEASPGEGHAQLTLTEHTTTNNRSSDGDPRPYTITNFTLKTNYADGPSSDAKSQVLCRLTENLRDPLKPQFTTRSLGGPDAIIPPVEALPSDWTQSLRSSITPANEVPAVAPPGWRAIQPESSHVTPHHNPRD